MNSELNRTILIVDDDKDVRLGTQLRLRDAGYETLEAVNGMDGLEMAVRTQPDAILLDVRMPVMDGLTALSLLQDDETTRDIPVIMLSASLVDQSTAFDSGARFFLAKPYKGPDILNLLEAAFE